MGVLVVVVYFLTVVAGLAVSSRLTVVVRVGAGPLHVHQIICGHAQLVGHKVVLDARVHLHDVASFAAHVQVVDVGHVFDGS